MKIARYPRARALNEGTSGHLIVGPSARLIVPETSSVDRFAGVSPCRPSNSSRHWTNWTKLRFSSGVADVLSHWPTDPWDVPMAPRARR